MINIFSAKGRIGRLIYFFWMLVIAFLAAVEAVAHIIMLDENCDEYVIYLLPVYVITCLLTVIPMVRRLHDMDKSGSLCLLSLIPIVNLGLGLYLLFGKGNVGTNKYGPPPRKLLMSSYDDALYQQAYEELESGQINKGLWAKALVESDGNESKARAKYIKTRCKNMLMDEAEKRRAEVMEMDLIKNEEIAKKSAAAILYKQAYVLHYRKRDKEQAKIVYDEILHNHPNSPEASSAKYQLGRLKL